MAICVVGGGVIGLLTAYELAQAGRAVIVIDRGRLGRESSWAGGGILSPLYPWRYPAAVSSLALWGQQRYPSLTKELFDASGVDAEWTPSGTLTVAAPDADLAVRWAEKHRTNTHLVSAAKLQELEPGLLVDGPALLDEGVAQIRSPRLLSALAHTLRRKGVEIWENVVVEGVVTGRGRLQALRTSRGELQAQQCIVTAGAWTGQLLAQTGLTLPIRPVRGQMLVLRAQPGLVRHIVLKEGRYLVPRREGRILVGSTIEEVGFDHSTTLAAREELWAAAVGLVSALADYEIEHQWAGLRPGSPEGIPYIGAHPEIRGLFVSTGHYRNGIVLAPASARLAADLMLGREPLLDPIPYALARAV